MLTDTIGYIRFGNFTHTTHGDVVATRGRATQRQGAEDGRAGEAHVQGLKFRVNNGYGAEADKILQMGQNLQTKQEKRTATFSLYSLQLLLPPLLLF